MNDIMNVISLAIPTFCGCGANLCEQLKEHEARLNEVSQNEAIERCVERKDYCWSILGYC